MRQRRAPRPPAAVRDRVPIRPLTATDVDVCAQILVDNPLWRRYGVTLARARTSIRGALRVAPGLPGEEFAVAHRRGVVVGFIGYLLAGTFSHSGYVRVVAVTPSEQGGGVGAALLAHAERHIFRRAADVFLLVSHFNRRAQAFYRRNGYTKVGEIRDYVVPGITEYIYRKARTLKEGHL
jgi:[ribosomal protein S18]-alanine N-acetyltransferase